MMKIKLAVLSVLFGISLFGMVTSNHLNYTYRFDVHPLEKCPKNAQEFETAAKRKNCTGNSRYLCAPDKYLSNLIEFCTDRPKSLFKSGNCVRLEGTGDLNHYRCEDKFHRGCPTKPYTDEEIYKYPACLDLNIQFHCFAADKDCPERLDKYESDDFKKEESINETSTEKFDGSTKSYGAIVITVVVVIMATVTGIIAFFVIKQRNYKAVSTELEEHGNTVNHSGAIRSPKKQLLDVPRIIAVVDTGENILFSVSCLSNDYVWTIGKCHLMLYSLQGVLEKSIETGDQPLDIAVTSDDELVYTNPEKRTVNIVKNTKIQAVIALEGWQPFGVCSTSSGDLLIVVRSDDRKQTKVVRYFGSTPKLSIQYNNKGQPLYSSIGMFFISENGNLDICVSDYTAGAVVVVSQVGQPRFKYTGPSFTLQFGPLGIATDSNNLILTADCINKCIHIIDENGQFIKYIDNCQLSFPYGICMDTKGNLFVAERMSGKLKKIQYNM